ncbi:lysozyme [Leisingera sp. M523]|uniref:lysozyme n=1 Tax=Leisingera sp. M523 TaxID=2867013 RepID=UPI0021A6928C|nr:lysozyme [Leisingera sp. M523]UWQ29922.1 lysozyme [Leisingera sp. M523]
MKLIPNWKEVLTGSWSVLFIIAGLISLAGFFFALVTAEQLGWNPVWFATAAASFQALALPARLLLQAGLRRFREDTSGAVSRRGVGVIAGSAIALSSAVGFVGQWEGLRTEAYRDIVGVWTVCYGETKGVQPGDSYTKAECDRMLAEEVASYEAQLDRCLTATVPVGMKIALVSWTYNVGPGAACRSTLVRKANAGDLVGACHELPRWNRAGGRVIRGLTNRRASERTMCLKSLEAAA